MRFVRATCIGSLLVLSITSHAIGGGVSPRASGFIDVAEECDGALVPAATSIYPVEDDTEITLEVHFLLDEVSLSKGVAAAAFVARPYGRVGIKLVPTFEEVSFPTNATGADGGPLIDSLKLIQLSKEHVGGIRPHGTDAVYTFTSKEIVGSLGGSVAGQADCVGGVVSPAEAFGVGEGGTADTETAIHKAGRIAAHEIAHLLGAHHHYANCAEADQQDATSRFLLCTLMFNDVGLVSLKFSTLESAAVRGYALEYANATPVGPPPLEQRSIDLRATKKQMKGSLASERLECYETVGATIEKLTRGKWVLVAEGETDSIGDVTFPLPSGPGRYRAAAGEQTMHDDDGWFTCSGAVSPEVVFP